MKTKVAALVCGAVLLTGWAPITASATERRGTINQREHTQRLRIRQGIRSGELTRPEAGRLAREQSRIRILERRARQDRELERRERIRLQRELNQANRHIYRQKHDNQKQQ